MFGYRIKKQYRTKVRLSCMGCLTFVVLIITSICRCTCSSCSRPDTTTSRDTTSTHIVHLNDTLSNALSDQPELHAMDSIMRRYLKRWEINGAQLAISRHDSLLYARGFGFSDISRQQPMEPSQIMRMASVSKLVTAVGIMKLRDMGKVRLTDKVFGPQGILNDTFYVNSIRDKRYFDITVSSCCAIRLVSPTTLATRYSLRATSCSRTTSPLHPTTATCCASYCAVTSDIRQARCNATATSATRCSRSSSRNARACRTRSSCSVMCSNLQAASTST